MPTKILIRTISSGTLLVLLGFLVACTDKPPSVQPLVCSEGQISVIGSMRSFCIEFFQVDQEVDNAEELHSPLGMAELSFENEPNLLHFNLKVNNIFRVLNIPIVSDDRDESSQTSVVFYFDLDSDSGTAISQLQYTADLTPRPLTTNIIETSAKKADVKPAKVALFSGEDTEELLLDAPPAMLNGGRGAKNNAVGHINANFPNQDVGKKECVPGAISNSMRFLNDKHDLKLSEEQMSIEAWKEIVHFRSTGTPTGWWDLKAAHLDSAGYGVTSTTSTDIADAIKALDNNCDVEIQVKGHAGALVQITELKNGRYSIGVAQDTHQGNTGGTKTKGGKTKIDMGTFSTRYSNPGKFHGIYGMRGKKLQFFVIECSTS